MLLLARDPDRDERGPDRILANTKNNLGPEAPSLRCTVEAVSLEPVVVDGREQQPLTTTSKIVIGDECGVSGSMLLAASSGDPNGESRTAVDEAKQFLLATLASGPVRKKELLVEAKAAGIKEMTLRRAKDALEVVARQVTGAQHAGWMWALPDADSDAHEADRLTTNKADDHVTDRALDRGDTGDREASEDTSCVQERSPDRETPSTQEGDVDA